MMMLLLPGVQDPPNTFTSNVYSSRLRLHPALLLAGLALPSRLHLHLLLLLCRQLPR
jgi:hypothetical protein